VNGVPKQHRQHLLTMLSGCAIHFPLTMMLMKSATEVRNEHPSETYLAYNDAYSLT